MVPETVNGDEPEGQNVCAFPAFVFPPENNSHVEPLARRIGVRRLRSAPAPCLWRGVYSNDDLSTKKARRLAPAGLPVRLCLCGRLDGLDLLLRLGADDATGDAELVVDHHVEAVAVVVRPHGTDRSPDFLLAPLDRGNDVGDVGWLLMVVSPSVVKPPKWWLRWRSFKTASRRGQKSPLREHRRNFACRFLPVYKKRSKIPRSHLWNA